MSIIKINPEDKQRYTIVANPRRTFSSSSVSIGGVTTAGVTGTLPLFPDASPRIKDIADNDGVKDAQTFGVNIDPFSDGLLAYFGVGKTSLGTDALVEEYLEGINKIPSSSIFNKKQSVIRFQPGDRLDADFLRKSTIKNMLFPYYRNQYPTAQYNYTNYHCLNFTTSSMLPESSALIYPAGTGSVDVEDYNPYAPSEAFTFDFYINPRYTEENVGDGFTAGTVLHMSSCYAVSLVTGSSVGLDGKVDGYRLLLQLSQSAEIAPSTLTIEGNSISAPDASAKSDLIFISPDNSLRRNEWHHVAIRWGGPTIENATGSFVVDNRVVSHFAIPSSSVMSPFSDSLPANKHDADALFVGNFYEGSNRGANPIAGFFNSTAASRFGILDFAPGADLSDPTDFTLRHPLNAEIHDLKIFNVYRSIDQIFSGSKFGIDYSSEALRSHGNTKSSDLTFGLSAAGGLLFYVPPYFTQLTPKREINQTPFFQFSGTSEDPFNVAQAFQVSGHELNLPNFTREFVRGFFPRPFGLEATRIGTTTSVKSANAFLYESGSHRKRNISVLPCDNGKFKPNFKTAFTGSFEGGLTSEDQAKALNASFINDFKQLDFSIIKLDNLVSTADIILPADVEALGEETTTGLKKLSTGSILFTLEGAAPEDPSIAPGAIPTVLQRTKDPSSNAVVIYDISNMFYGDRIKPNSVVLKDLAVTGTAGRVQITLRDDGNGNLYRADSVPPHATWSSVGNVIYEEGIVIVKSPNIPLFGSDAWEISFEGQRNMHVLEYNIVADKGIINSSSNPTYRDLIPSSNESETAKRFVYLTGLQLHDDNLNVIGRANLAQPIVKRDDDRYTIKLRMDF